MIETVTAPIAKFDEVLVTLAAFNASVLIQEADSTAIAPSISACAASDLTSAGAVSPAKKVEELLE
eukprot:CAMPEP_0172716114 /NCGR_PEP_ID=MMETSP1074-20121228/67936_1 /TAXON_ID=2916 /ORGANISM="Ceratium fusus, Strain PA161109" /LENGTH=65 /DNA_ID=CAMNT_0013540765 /DNA_START=126 /DNA_END=324 /DNA_ORIENTATION=+